jgi:DNA ligase 1
MKQFAGLFMRLDQSNKTTDKVVALKDFFLSAPDEDRLWTLALFTHKRPKRQVNTRLLRQWTCELAQIPDWLFEESYHSVGDLAETISLLLPVTNVEQDFSLSYWIRYLMDLQNQDENTKKERILEAWQMMNKEERFVFIKLMTGSFRIGVSQNLITQAVAGAFDLEKTEVAHRIMGDWNPLNVSFHDLLLSQKQSDDLSRPYPFFLAYPLEKELSSFGEFSDWQIEWKWDGIRGQVIQREGEVFIWSRGEELVTDKFPELKEMALELPSGTVLDGEIIAYSEGMPLPFALLQTRIGRKTLSKKILTDAPVSFIAYDVLEHDGRDFRNNPIMDRRVVLEKLVENVSNQRLVVSPLVEADNWEDLTTLQSESRMRMAEGFMLKKTDSPYEVGRKRGAWWKWKIEPLSIDGVLLYAQKGHGRRADLFTDYTLAVWEGDKLVPFAKAYSGLTDEEIREVDKYVKQNTKEKFGPVRTVKPALVFEIAFEGIQESTRHKSGIALRFPRIQRWRKDKPIEEANTLDDLKALLSVYGR